MIFVHLLSRLHNITVNLLAIFIAISTVFLIWYAMSRDKIITAIQSIFTKKITND